MKTTMCSPAMACRRYCWIVLVALAEIVSSAAFAIETQQFTSGVGASCTDSSCAQIYQARAQIQGTDQYEAVCQQLWASAAYIFPVDAYSFGNADGNCYYHHVYSPDSHIPFGSWANVSIVDPKNNGPSCPAEKNPINPAVGNKYQVELDYEDATGSGLRFDRTYNSEVFVQTARLGTNWRSSYDRTIVARLVNGQLSGQSPVMAHRQDGKTLRFDNVSGQLVPSADVASHLVALTDVNGQVTGFRYTSSSKDEIEIYNSAGKLQTIATRAGLVLTLAYNTQGALQTVTDSFGRQLSFAYDTSGRVSTMTDPAGSMYQFGYGASNNLASVTYPGGAQRIYHYNEPANTSGASLPNALTGITDESSNRYATFKYDTSGYANSTEHAGSVENATLSYGSTTATVTDGLGAVRTYGFQTILGVSRLVSQSQPAASGCAAASMAQSYDANGNVASLTDFNGNQTTYTYDAARNLETSRTEAYGTARARTITTQWHATYRVPTQIDEPGRRTTYTYDASGNALTKTVLDTATSVARVWTYTYNSYGQVLTADGPRTDVSDVTTYTYYSCSTGYQCGQVHTITDALGHITSYGTYNAHGQPLTVTDANSVVTTLTYDARQRLTSRTVGSETTTFDYWPTGLLKKVTLADGSFIAYGYDAAHRLTDINDADGNHVQYTLDAMGNHTKEESFDPSSALSLKRTQVFNALSQLYQQIGAAGGASVTTTYGHDGNGNLTSTAAPSGRNSSQSYDELNRLTSITDPASGLTAYGYNALDQLISVSDPRGLSTSYTYSALGDLKQQVSPDTGTTVNTFDSGGNLKTSTDARSAITTYTYDALNRMTTAAFKKGSTTDQTLTYSYDAGSNGMGHLTSASDSAHALTWTFDAQGRVTSKQQTQGTVTHTVTYGYTNGLLTSLTTPSSQAITYGYTNGKITSVSINGTTLLGSVLYEPFGPVRQWTWGNGTLAVRTFDEDGKVTLIDSAGVKTYAYDDAFRITGITDGTTPSLSWTYGYDALDRLNSATSSSQTLGWTYDADGNRLTQTGIAQTLTYPTTNNRVSGIAGTPTKTYAYDAAGNITGDGTRTFAYNNRGRMKSTTSGSTTINYTYNALGQRIKKSGTTRLFAYDEAGHLLGEYNSSGALVQETIWMDDIPVATIRPKTGGVDIFYVHTDHLNTPRKVTRPSDNKLRWRWDSTAYGTGAPNENPQSLGAFSYNLRYPGQYFDPETGLHYNYFRDYDPTIGRYAQSDPIGLAGGIDLYTYAEGNPIRLIDPLGLDSRGADGEPTAPPSCEPLFPAFTQGTPEFDKLVSSGDQFLDDIKNHALGTYIDQAMAIQDFIMLAKAHTKGARQSTKAKHEKGQARKGSDRGGEKADPVRRPPRKRPDNWKGPWP